MKCSSFNTTVDLTQLVGHEAAAFLGDVDTQPPDGAHAAFGGNVGGGSSTGSSADVAAAAVGGVAGPGGTDQPTGSAAAMAQQAIAAAAAGGGEAMAAAALGNLPPGMLPSGHASPDDDIDMDDMDQNQRG